MIEVSELTTKLVEIEPKEKSVAAVKPLPLMVTACPPLVLADVADSAETVGAAPAT